MLQIERQLLPSADGNYSKLHGIVVGGNIRCFLKLAGTEYTPDLTDKILLLENYSETAARMETYLCQLEQLDRRYAGEDMPIAVTKQIGHGTDAKGIWIGKAVLNDYDKMN